MKSYAWTVLLTVALLFAFCNVAGDLPQIVAGFPHAKRYITEMFPPDWSVLPHLYKPLLETIRMGVVSIILSSVIAVPVSFLAARSTTPHLAVYILARAVINVCRGLPTMVWALLCVAMLGLGPLPGIVALTVHCVGTLGKYFSEAIETTAPVIREAMDAMRVNGANELQVFYYGLLREVAPLFAGYILYYFEWALRVGATLGLVGAGGLGLQLTMTIRLFKRQQTLAIVLVILTMVTLVDLGSWQIRKRLV